MNTRKIAVVRAQPWAGYTDFTGVTPNHYRYSLYERKVPTGTNDYRGKPEYANLSNIVLRYEDLSIQEFLSQAKITFNVRRGVLARRTAGTADDTKCYAHVSAEVSGDDRIIAKRIGEYGGYQCYVVYLLSDEECRESPTYFHISSVPDYGRPSVGYDRKIARDCFIDINITNTIHEQGNMDRAAQLELFDYIDAEVAEVMAPMIALMKPVKE